MRYLLILIISLMYSGSVFGQEAFYNFMEQEKYERKQQEKLFKVSNNEAADLEKVDFYSDLNSLPYYPVLKIDFFNILRIENHEDKMFTYILKNTSVREGTCLGIRLRMSVGHSNY